MRLTYLEAVCTLALIAACPGKDGGESETDPQAPSSSSSGGSETSAETPTSGTAEPPADTEDEPGATVGETMGDDTAGEDTVGDDTVGDTGIETGQAFPAECVEADPSVSAAFTLDLSAWPIDQEAHLVADVACVVDEVTSAGGTVSTKLTCVHEGLPVAATLAFAAAPEGEVTWAAADAVKLSSLLWGGGIDEGSGHDVQLRGADDALLMSGVAELGGDAVEGRFKPLELEFDDVCSEGLDDEYPVRIEFTVPEQAPVAIFSGHRAALPIDAASAFAVDVEKAMSNGSYDLEFKVLLRRVTTGG